MKVYARAARVEELKKKGYTVIENDDYSGLGLDRRATAAARATADLVAMNKPETKAEVVKKGVKSKNEKS